MLLENLDILVKQLSKLSIKSYLYHKIYSLKTYQNIIKLIIHQIFMEKDIGKIKKNDITEIVIRIDDFGGKKGLTIREYTTSERYTGFTKSGTRIAAESFKDFKKMINSIDEKDLEMPEGEKPIDFESEEQASEEPKEEKPKKSKKKIDNPVQEELF